VPDDGDRDLEPHFPEGRGANDFIRAYRAAVVPGEKKRRQRKSRAVLPPVMLLTTGDERGPRAHRVLPWLDLCLRHPDKFPAPKLVPHATMTGEEIRAHARPLTLDLVERLEDGIPEKTGRLRLPNFRLMRDIADAPASSSAKALRNHCYTERRERGPLLNALWSLGGKDPAPAGGLAAVWHFLAGPCFQEFPRWWWGHRCTRRLVRSKRHGWYARAQGLPHGRNITEFFGHARRNAARNIEELLLHALFEDLKTATRPTWISPWRRRRTTRYAFLLELPPDSPDGRGARFIRAYAEAVEKSSCTATVLVAAGPAESAADGADSTLSNAALRLSARSGGPGGTVRPLVVHLPDNAPAWPEEGRPVEPVVPRTWTLGPATSTALQSVAVATALGVVAGVLVPRIVGEGDDNDCLGSAADGQPAPPPQEHEPDWLLRQYREAQRIISNENARAEEAAQLGDTVRTVAYLGTAVSGNADQEEQRSDGAVPELRGIALAQRELNDEARSDDHKVWLRVEWYDAGEEFADAPEAAREIKARAEAAPDDFIGVVGIAQSRDVTKEAVAILNAAQIPVITTNATADEMQTGNYYHQMAPPSSREAEIASHFTHEANIVEDGAGGCAPADAAIVIQDPADLYSASLGDSFSDQFAAGGGEWRKLWYTPEGETRTGTPGLPDDPRITREESPHGVAEAVCELMRSEPERNWVVYWASRAREFDSFLNDFEDSIGCAGDRLTVVGGNELTNAVLSGMYETSSWLRLYHAVHVLPVGQSLSHISEPFNAAYAAEFGEDDLWRNDGHAALAYDTMQVIGEAANQAYESSDGNSVDGATVQDNLHDGIDKAGASGAIQFPEGEPVSQDKPLVILHHTDSGSEPVLACGAFAPNDDPVEVWGPGDEFTCPPDE
jgi:ABC-type branched-subunit amino acid transport system substrate-binding protein